MSDPPLDSNQHAHLLIARFLSHQDYSATLSSFLSEATSKHPQLRLHPNAKQQDGEDWNDLVEEWIARKVSNIKLQDEDGKLQEMLNHLEANDTDEARMPEKVRTIVKEATNVLNVRRGILPKKEWDSATLEFKS
jgi:hypothetical protein